MEPPKYTPYVGGRKNDITPRNASLASKNSFQNMKNFPLYFRVKITKNTKVKKGKQGIKIGLWSRKRNVLKIDFTANKKDTIKKLNKVSLFAQPY